VWLYFRTDATLKIELNAMKQTLPSGVMLNIYPDSIGENLADAIGMLQAPALENAFSLIYILPTFFHSDMDGGFSIVDYDLNEELVSTDDLKALDDLGIQIKLDLVVNHLSARSPQFIDLMNKGDASEYADFFIDWDEFWKDHGTMGEAGHIVPHVEYLEMLFLRKPELPVMSVRFPRGEIKTFWNTFYQKVDYDQLTAEDFERIDGIDHARAGHILESVRDILEEEGVIQGDDLERIAGHDEAIKDALIHVLSSKIVYLGQLDLNAQSERVWQFYDETLAKFRAFGAKIIRLDAFGYLHKEPGLANFFNRPGTWEYLSRLRDMAEKHQLTVFPEVHSQYGAGTHEEVDAHGYPIYDFFFPGLTIDAMERADNRALVRWIEDIQQKGLQTINMLGCHDGIPMMDLRGKEVDGEYRPGLLADEHIDATVDAILSRGGLTKNLYNAEGKKIDYYQVNATYFSALGEDEQKLLLARAIQMFMPGLPQVWYLDLFAGTNDYEAANRGNADSHKEINRTRMRAEEIEEKLQLPIVRDQLELIRLRNTSPVFAGTMTVIETEPHLLHMAWRKDGAGLVLKADLRDHRFSIHQLDCDEETILMMLPREG
jgi:sucrose phosphorylase